MSPNPLRTALLALALLLQSTTPSFAQTVEETIKATLEARMRPGAKVEGVRKTPYLGLYEARVGQELVYTDEKVTYVFAGEILDGKTFENFTKARLEELSAVAFSDLPLEKNAIKIVRGNGQRKVAYFADPNCGYCKKFEKETLAAINNATIYIVPYPILSEDSAVKSRAIWCSGDKVKAWNDWMNSGKAPGAKGDCENPINANQDLGRRLNITGTPTMFFEDGKRIVGAVEQRALESKFAQVAKDAKK